MAWSEDEHAVLQSLTDFLSVRLTSSVHRYVVGFSAGPDSMALAWALSRLPESLSRPLHLVHVHHGLHPQADAWALIARQFAGRIGAGFALHRVKVAGDANVEAEARALRYRAIASETGPDDVVLLAHHRDDQAETLLLRLCRGAGVTGLAAMREVSWLPSPGVRRQCWRPLLSTSRADLTALLAEAGLEPVLDDSNENIRYRRNFLRHEILPRLERASPGTAERLTGTAQLMRETDDLLAELAREWLAPLQRPDGGLDIPGLLALPETRFNLVVRQWFMEAGLHLPGRALLARLRREVCEAREDAAPSLRWSGTDLRRYRSVLHAVPVARGTDRRWRVGWPFGQKELSLPDGRRLSWERADTGAVDPERLQRASISVALRQGGERIRLPGRAHRTPLKNLFQDGGVPPWRRDHVPLIYADGELAVVGSWWVSDAFAVRGAGWRLREVSWLPTNSTGPISSIP